MCQHALLSSISHDQTYISLKASYRYPQAPSWSSAAVQEPVMILQAAVLSVLLCCVHSLPIQVTISLNITAVPA